MEQKRLYLAMILSGAILLVWQMFFVPEPPEPTLAEEQASEKLADNGQPEGDKSAPAKADGDQSPQDAAQDERSPAEPSKPVEKRNIPLRQDTLAGDFLKVELTNKDASVVSANILKPEQYAGEKPGDLVGFPTDAPEYPFSVKFVGKGLELPDDAVYEVVEEASKKGKDGAFDKIVYRYQDPRGRFRLDKTFTIDAELPYVVKMDVQVTNTSADQKALEDTMAVDILDWKDPDEESSFLDFNPIQVEGVCKTTNDIERNAHKSLEKESETFNEAPVVWGAVDTRYFMLAAIPEKPADSCTMEIAYKNYVRTRLVGHPFSVAPGKTLTLSHSLFMGPKDVDDMGLIGDKLSEGRDYNIKLTESVDYGIFAFVARPMRWGLAELFNLVGNWGLAIILLTFIIRAALWPINMKAYSSMERMKAVQPHLAEMKEKYKDDRQRQTEETMKLFKEHNVSPMGGCLPMILQMPVLYGLYVCIYNSVDLYNASFLYYDNLAAPDPLYILPAVMGVAMFLQQRMSTVDTQNKQAAMMMKVMPVMFTAFMVFLPAGLVLYYALSLLIGIGQQYFIRKKFEAEPEAAAAS